MTTRSGAELTGRHRDGSDLSRSSSDKMRPGNGAQHPPTLRGEPDAIGFQIARPASPPYGHVVGPPVEPVVPGVRWSDPPPPS